MIIRKVDKDITMVVHDVEEGQKMVYPYCTLKIGDRMAISCSPHGLLTNQWYICAEYHQHLSEKFKELIEEEAK